MSDKKKAGFWTFLTGIAEPFSKVITPIITLTGLAVGLWQFHQQQRISETQEFRRRVWDRKLQAYNDLAAITSQIMTSIGTPQFDSLSRRYKQVYWAAMPLLGDSVEHYMTDFDEEITSIRNDEGEPGVLRIRGYKLMRACKASLDSTFINANATR